MQKKSELNTKGKSKPYRVLLVIILVISKIRHEMTCHTKLIFLAALTEHIIRTCYNINLFLIGVVKLLIVAIEDILGFYLFG